MSVNEDRLTKLAFEARVLAYRDVLLAAERSHIPADIAKGYCDLFFDVLDRIDATRAIDGAVIESRRQRPDILRRELYHAAYFAGPFVAEHWITHLPALVDEVEADLSSPLGIERERLALSVLWRQVSESFYVGKPRKVYQRLLEQQPVAREYSESVFSRVVSVLVSEVGGRWSSDGAEISEQDRRPSRHRRKPRHAA